MQNGNLRTKPTESAHKLHALLSTIQSQLALNAQQQKAVQQDIRIVEEVISTLAEALSIDDWRSIWRTFLHVKRNLGAYVDNELGQKLAWLTEMLLQDIFDSYVEANKGQKV